jgi:hypothetical protein
MPELVLESSKKASRCLPHINMCQNGQIESCLAQSMAQQVSHTSSGLAKHPECLQLPATATLQHVPKWPNESCQSHSMPQQISYA